MDTVAFSPSGAQLAIGDDQGNICIYDVLSSTPPYHHLDSQGDPLNSVAITSLCWSTCSWRTNYQTQPDCGLFAAFEDGVIRVPCQKGFSFPKCHDGPVEAFAVGISDIFMASSSRGDVKIWNYDEPSDSWRLQATINGQEVPLRRSLEPIVRNIFFNPVDETLLIIYLAHGSWAFHPQTGRRLKPFISAPSVRLGVSDVSFTPDGSPIAAVFNQRDGYDVLPLSGLGSIPCGITTLPGKKLGLHPVAISADCGVVWGVWEDKGIVRGWSAKSGRVVSETQASLVIIKTITHTGRMALHPAIATLSSSLDHHRYTVDVWRYSVHQKHKPMVRGRSMQTLYLLLALLVIPLIALLLRDFHDFRDMLWAEDNVTTVSLPNFVFLGFY